MAPPPSWLRQDRGWDTLKAGTSRLLHWDVVGPQGKGLDQEGFRNKSEAQKLQFGGVLKANWRSSDL